MLARSRCGAALALLVVTGTVVAVTSGPGAAGAAAPSTAYRANDYADGQAMSILPPGENGLVNATDLAKFELTQTRPAASDDQLGKYSSLLYGSPNLTDAGLGSLLRRRVLRCAARRRDPHRAARNRRHHLPRHPRRAARLRQHRPDDGLRRRLRPGGGPALPDGRAAPLRKRHAGLLPRRLLRVRADGPRPVAAVAYTPAQAQAQVDALPKEYGAQGALAKSMIDNYVAGVNAYIDQTRTDPALLPADYAAALAPPQQWTDGDVVVDRRPDRRDLRPRRRLRGRERRPAAVPAEAARCHGRREPRFRSSRSRTTRPRRPPSSTSRSRTRSPGKINPATTAMPDNARAPLTGGPTDTRAELQPEQRPTRQRRRS